MGTGTRRGLIVGNYCHDVLFKDDVVIAETLGGAVSFISAVLDGLSVSSDYVSFVGSDFRYSVNHTPIVPSSSSRTTLFHAHFFSDPSETRRQDRVLKRILNCDPISPSHIPDSRFDFGMAVGVAGEILPETLEKMLDVCNVVFVDIQALIRVFDPIDGTVNLVGLKESGFFHLLPRIGFLKASAEEAPFVDVEEARKWCCVVVTNGKDGCNVYWKDGEVRISPFSTVQIDPTGAGDSFLGGLVAGLVEGLAVPDAALLGNFFGSLTVGQIGLPKFDSKLLQYGRYLGLVSAGFEVPSLGKIIHLDRVKDEVQKRKVNRRYDELKFVKAVDHQDFLESLVSAKLISTYPPPVQECQREVRSSPTTADQNHKSPPRYNGHLLLFPNNTVYNEPVKSVETKP